MTKEFFFPEVILVLLDQDEERDMTTVFILLFWEGCQTLLLLLWFNTEFKYLN